MKYKAYTFNSFKFCIFWWSSQEKYKLVIIFLLSNCNRHVIIFPKKDYNSEFLKMLIVFFSKPHFNIQSSNLKEKVTNQIKLNWGKVHNGDMPLVFRVQPHHGLTHSPAWIRLLSVHKFLFHTEKFLYLEKK